MNRITAPLAAALLASTAASAAAQSARFYDDQGRYQGRSREIGEGGTRFYDDQGRLIGRVRPDRAEREQQRRHWR